LNIKNQRRIWRYFINLIYINYCSSTRFTAKKIISRKSTLKEHFSESRRIEKSEAKVIVRTISFVWFIISLIYYLMHIFSWKTVFEKDNHSSMNILPKANLAITWSKACKELFFYLRRKKKIYFISKHLQDNMRKVYWEQRNRILFFIIIRYNCQSGNRCFKVITQRGINRQTSEKVSWRFEKIFVDVWMSGSVGAGSL